MPEEPGAEKASNPTDTAIRKVVVVGAGFGGLAVTKALAKAPVEITLLDRQNYHLFQPLLYQVATAALTPAEIAAPIRGVLRRQKNVTVFMDEVCAVDTAARSVATKAGRHIPYDALVLATGARHSYFGRDDDWAGHAPGLKTLDDALGLRQRILLAFERAEMAAADDHAGRAALQTFVIIGGGPTGVETAGAIAELARSIVYDFRRIDTANTRIILLEGGPRILSSFAPNLSERATRDLRDLGVEVRTDAMVTDIDGKGVHIGDETIPSRTVVWAAGVQASPAAEWLGMATDRAGHLPVGPTLEVEGLANVYAIGDTARFVPEGAEQPLPGIAPAAKQMGIYVGRRLARLAAGQNADRPFKYSDPGALATIGRNRAIANIYGMRFTGFIGWLLWGLAHVYFLIGFRSRLFVMLSWIWSYITWQRGVRLITHDR